MTRPIDLSSVLAATLSMRRRPMSRGTRTGAERAAPSERRLDQPPPPRELAQRLIQQVHRIPADDPQRERKAFRMFLELRLLDDLGRDLLADPGFNGFVDEVMARMEADADLRSQIRTAGRALLEAGSGG